MTPIAGTVCGVWFLFHSTLASLSVYLQIPVSTLNPMSLAFLLILQFQAVSLSQYRRTPLFDPKAQSLYYHLSSFQNTFFFAPSPSQIAHFLESPTFDLRSHLLFLHGLSCTGPRPRWERTKSNVHVTSSTVRCTFLATISTGSPALW